MSKLILIMDTSFLSEAKISEIKKVLNNSYEKYVTENVINEFKAAFFNNDDLRYSLLFNKEGKLKYGIKIISHEKCDKDIYEKISLDKKLYIKKSSILCSSYYFWLMHAINPSFITDPYRHEFNEALYKVRKNPEIFEKISKELGNSRQREIELLNKIQRNRGLTGECLDSKVIRTARKKRAKEFKKGTLVITDYQLITYALILMAFFRKNVLVFTCDKDLLDIKDNLYRSVYEKYFLNTLFEKKRNDLYKITKNTRFSFSL